MTSEKARRIAEFIGIMLGDGCIGIYDCKCGNKVKKQYQLKVTLDSRNKDYIAHVSRLFEEVLDVKPRLSLKTNENTADIRVFRRDKVLYALNELELKISPKWANMEIPEKYSKGELALFVLKGLFDTDGSVTIFKNNGILYPRIEIRICPSPAQNQILDILKKHDFSFKIQKLDKGDIKVRISGKKELKNWMNKVGTSNNLYFERAKQFL